MQAIVVENLFRFRMNLKWVYKQLLLNVLRLSIKANIQSKKNLKIKSQLICFFSWSNVGHFNQIHFKFGVGQK